MPPSWFETIKVREGTPAALRYHQSRIDKTIGKNLLDLANIIRSIALPSNGLYRLRVDYNRNGHVISSVLTPYKKRTINSLQIMESPHLIYPFKSTDRSAFEQAMKQATTDDIIFTQNGFVTDTSYTNILFGDGKNWVTPETVLLPGTKRQYLLDEGMISTASVHYSEINAYSHCSLINAMLDPGDIVIPTEQIIY